MCIRNSLIIIFFLIFTFGCENKGRSIDGIYVSPLLVNHKLDNYIELVQKSMSKNLIAIRLLSSMNPKEAKGYDHGVVLVEVYERIGEECVLTAINLFSLKEKERLMSFIIVGLEYTQFKKLINKPIKEAFPLLNNFLKQKTL